MLTELNFIDIPEITDDPPLKKDIFTLQFGNS